METSVILPPVLYLEGHYDGWQECLLYTAGHGLGHETGPESRSMFEPYMMKGLEEGYADCAKHLESRFRDDPGKARLYCRSHYLPHGVQKRVTGKPAVKQDTPPANPDANETFEFD